MKISTILDHIDNGHMALPEFQRGYVLNRDQVRGLFDSLYRRHPVGGLLVWPSGIQEALSQPVVVLLNEDSETIAVASQSGIRCFTSVAEFQTYERSEVLVEGTAA